MDKGQDAILPASRLFHPLPPHLQLPENGTLALVSNARGADPTGFKALLVVGIVIPPSSSKSPKCQSQLLVCTLPIGCRIYKFFFFPSNSRE